MTPKEILHYAIGELAYAMAAADGEVQKEERQKFHDIVRQAVENERHAADFSVFMFQMTDKQNTEVKSAYNRAIAFIKQNGSHFTPELRRITLSVMKQVALAFPPLTDQEKKLIARFEKDTGWAVDPPETNNTTGK